MRDNKPLLTLFILVYNNENFIKEAVMSALNQTYEPLEIIISDDNSQDASFTTIMSLIKDYNGPHSIVLNKNEENQGICGHINKIVSIAKGEFLIVLAGDDIADRERVENIYLHNKLNNSMFLTTDYYSYDSITGKKELVIKKNVNTLDIYKFFDQEVVGATEAFSKKIFEIFGDLNKQNFIEDRALAFRAFLMNKVSYLDKPTVCYRIHADNLSVANYLKRDQHSLKNHFDKWYPTMICLFNQHLKDLEIAYRNDLITSENYNKLKCKLTNYLLKTKYQYKIDLYWINNLVNENIFKIIVLAIKSGVSISFISWRLLKKIKGNCIIK